MVKILIFTLLVVLMSLTGCAGLPTRPEPKKLDPETIVKETVVKYDPYSRVTIYDGPWRGGPFSGYEDMPYEYLLIASKTGDGPITYRVTVNVINFTDFIFDRARDIEGEVYQVSIGRIDHSYLPPKYTRNSSLVDIKLPREYLESHKKEGISFRMYGTTNAMFATSGMSKPFSIPGSYIEGFLNKVDSNRSEE